MIRLFVTAFGLANRVDGLHFEIDATPWFQQATAKQLRKLKSEFYGPRQLGDNKSHFYAGEQTDDIFGWLAENAPTPQTKQIISHCNATNSAWGVELSGSDVRAWFLQQQASQVARQAVNDLLGT